MKEMVDPQVSTTDIRRRGEPLTEAQERAIGVQGAALYKALDISPATQALVYDLIERTIRAERAALVSTVPQLDEALSTARCAAADCGHTRASHRYVEAGAGVALVCVECKGVTTNFGMHAFQPVSTVPEHLLDDKPRCAAVYVAARTEYGYERGESWRCDLAPLHDGDHINFDLGGVQWPQGQTRPLTAQPERTAPSASSRVSITTSRSGPPAQTSRIATRPAAST